MFRNLNKTYLALCVLLIGTCSWTFGIDFSQALTQANDRSLSLSSIFHGKSFVSNLYSKALQSVKDREVIATNVSFQGMKAYYTNCPGVKESDFINVLYNYNTSFQITFKQLFPKVSNTQQPMISKRVIKNFWHVVLILLDLLHKHR